MERKYFLACLKFSFSASENTAKPYPFFARHRAQQIEHWRENIGCNSFILPLASSLQFLPALFKDSTCVIMWKHFRSLMPHTKGLVHDSLLWPIFLYLPPTGFLRRYRNKRISSPPGRFCHITASTTAQMFNRRFSVRPAPTAFLRALANSLIWRLSRAIMGVWQIANIRNWAVAQSKLKSFRANDTSFVITIFTPDSFCQRLAVGEASSTRKNSLNGDLLDQYVWTNRTDTQHNCHQPKKSWSVLTTQISPSAFPVCLQISWWIHHLAITIKDLADLINIFDSNKNYILWALLINKNITMGSLYRLLTSRPFELSLHLHTAIRYSMAASALSITCTTSMGNLVQPVYF